MSVPYSLIFKIPKIKYNMIMYGVDFKDCYQKLRELKNETPEIDELIILKPTANQMYKELLVK